MAGEDNPYAVHDILEPIEDKATPQGEMRNFMELIDNQLGAGSDDPATMVMFGAPKSALMRIRAAMECGIQALDVFERQGAS